MCSEVHEVFIYFTDFYENDGFVGAVTLYEFLKLIMHALS